MDAFTSAAGERSSPSSPFSPPFAGLNDRRSPKCATLNGMDEIEAWSASVVLLFIQFKILGDLVTLGLRCLPPHAKAIVISEQAHWKRFLDLKVMSELKLLGIFPPPPFMARQLAPMEMKFDIPDYSSAAGTSTEKKALLAAAKTLYDDAKNNYDAQRAASESQNNAFNADAFKIHQASELQFEKQREATLLVLRDHHMSEARLAVFCEIS